ncbi:MAG: MmpS family transport accessory protein [Sporichthyaceae bacterium]
MFVLVGAVAVIAPKVLDGDDGAENPVFSSTTREVTYEIVGTGVAEQITFTSGEANATKTITNVTMPWKQTVVIPVGVAGGTANVIASNPRNDTTITCRISIGGRAVKEVNATDGYVDPGCSVQLQPELVD